jgi:TPR repeat protein
MKIAASIVTGVVLSLAVGDSAFSGGIPDMLAAYHRRDYVHAAPRLLLQAERGNAAAQTAAGFMYQHGFGVPQNQVLAAH